MTQIPDCPTTLEVLRLISSDESTWGSRYVTIRFQSASKGWILVYPLLVDTAPCFDVMYTSDEPPERVFADLLRRHAGSLVLDWSPSRSACIEVPVSDVETLADVMFAIAATAWGESTALVEASYEEMERA